MSSTNAGLSVEYLGNLHTKVTHGLSGQNFMTDAPLDNQGKGEFISPTDMLACAAGACMATIMGTKAKADNIDIDGMKIKVRKEMESAPQRRIGCLIFDITFPHKLSEKEQTILTNVVKNCPVVRSLNPEIMIDYAFHYAE